MIYQGGQLVAEVVRSGLVEGRHHGSVVVLDADGKPVDSAGDVTAPIYPRSSNKPLQAVGMLHGGLALAEPADLAVVCASHWGQEFHLTRIAGMLARAGLDASALGCPPSLPLDDDARVAVLAAGGGPTRLAMNCSGKHTGMLLTCLANGWPLAGYLEPAHPLQRRLREAVAAATGEPVATTGVDGCGAPLFTTSLTGLASAFLALVHAEPGTAERSVADAMRSFPQLVAGESAAAADTHLMRAVPGLVAKSGAEAVMAVAVAGVGAVALKIDDGAARARVPVLCSALRRLGVRPELPAGLADSPVLGGGVQVGQVRAVW